MTLLPSLLMAQLSSGGIPVSTLYSLKTDHQNVVSVSSPDLSSVRQEDALYPTPYRFALALPVDISPEKSGIWEKTPDGGKIWRIELLSPGAKALSAFFDKFSVPDGGKVFLYDSAKNKVIGAFTSRNNVSNGYFATELIPGDRLILEYYQPSGTIGSPSIHMYSIDYAYRGVEFLNPGQQAEAPLSTCEVNVKCPEGDAWQDEVKGAARIHITKYGAGWWCSGSLLNNVRNDQKPYMLTADHCFFGTTAADLQQWVFYFGYEAPTCIYDPTLNPGSKSMTGATLKSHGGNSGDTGSDFCLVMLNQSIPDTFDVYFNGWNRKDTTSPSGVCIHHPEGGIKKISTYNQPLVTANWTGNPNPCHWKVSWIATQDGHGVTEGGSSGSPLFDNQGRVVGTLTGGYSACDSASLDLPDYYGKFSWSWDKNGTDSTTRLKDWLDPDNTGVFQLKGLMVGIPILSKPLTISISPNPFTDYVQVNIEGISGETAQYAVFNLMGTVIATGTITPTGSSAISLSLPGLASGMYFLRITLPGSVSTIKMIRQ
jgi:hypothetical protein